jgi:hypothetical protein
LATRVELAVGPDFRAGQLLRPNIHAEERNCFTWRDTASLIARRVDDAAFYTTGLPDHVQSHPDFLRELMALAARMLISPSYVPAPGPRDWRNTEVRRGAARRGVTWSQLPP